MLYVITEDSNSGRDFWKVAFGVLMNAGEYKVVDFLKNSNGDDITGNYSLDAQVDEVLRYAKPGDSIFVALDNIGSSTRLNSKTNKSIGFDSGDFVNNTMYKCQQASVGLYISSYYCFEEVYLSYIELENLVKADSRDIGKGALIAPVIKYVRECIENGVEYYDRNRPEVQSIISIKTDATTNKEHFADALLYHASSNIKHGRFTIAKAQDKKWRCWLLDCADLQSRGTSRDYPYIDYDCANCKFKMKECIKQEKLMDLDDDFMKIASNKFMIQMI